ncbi:hypothetical protein [Microbacterium sp. NPDC056052]|uniref:hypothetical protein n=1 Tax=Microbacterium sp. NPDC056052 TaxID=3345695 RepID=UPI0035DA942E
MTRWLSVAAAMIGWVAVQELTPSLSAFDPRVMESQALLLQGCVATAVALVLTLVYPDDARAMFAYSKATWLYALVPVAVVVLVVRTGAGPDLLAVLWWVAVAVVWRWFLFGMLQRRLSEWLPPSTVLLTSAALLASWLLFGVVASAAEALRFPLGVLIALLLSTLLAIIPSAIMLAQKNVHVLVVMNLVAATLVV